MRRILLGILVATALSATGWAQGPKKLALLIGVNDYTKGPASWDLRGCVNDVKMTREVLINKYGFPPDNIKTLVDAEATAKNIIAAPRHFLGRKENARVVIAMSAMGGAALATSQ